MLSHLSSNYPWAPQSRNEDECFQCSTNTEIKISCRKPGVSYRILCTKCPLNGVGAAYEGETGKCLFVRGTWPMKEFKDGVATNAVYSTRTGEEAAKTCSSLTHQSNVGILVTEELVIYI